MLRTRRLFQQCEAGMWSLLDGSSFRTVQRFSSVSVTALETQHITVPIAPGKRLAIHASSPSHIHIKVGELESISVEIQARHQGFHTKETDEGLGMCAHADISEAAGAGHQESIITAWIPERFCGVDLQSRGGSIRIQSVTEASARASSSGGDMDVGTIKGTDAAFDTGGGSLTGTVTAGDVKIDTRGGSLHVKRLVGVTVHAQSGGGALRVGVAYCDDVTIDSGGADVSIDHLNCRGASVLSHGGAIVVAGLDGRANVVSQGGPIDVQVTEKATAVMCESGGGGIVAKLVPALAASVHVQADGGIHVAPDLGIPSSEGQTELQAGKAAEEPANDAANSRCPGHSGALVLDAGSGSVSLSKLSWIASIAARIKQQKSGDL